MEHKLCHISDKNTYRPRGHRSGSNPLCMVRNKSYVISRKKTTQRPHPYVRVNVTMYGGEQSLCNRKIQKQYMQANMS